MFECTSAVVRGKSQPFEITKLQLEDPRPDEVVVEIVGVGVCHTDIVVRDQYYPTPLPAVLGHEGAGIVIKVGSAVTKVVPGDHVVLAFGSCGKCENCRKGEAGYCLEFFGCNFGGSRSDGSTPYRCCSGERVSGCFFSQSSFGTHALATERNVVKIDKRVPLEIMAPRLWYFDGRWHGDECASSCCGNKHRDIWSRLGWPRRNYGCESCWLHDDRGRRCKRRAA